MKMRWIWTLSIPLLAAGIALAARAQKGAEPPARDRGTPLTPVDEQERAPQEELSPLEPSFDAEAWRAALAAEDFGARRRAMRELAREARANPQALHALEQWAADTSSCLGWTAYLTLEEAREGAGAGPFGGGFFRGPHGGLFGHDPFGRGGPGRDPFGSRLFGGGDPFAVRDLLREMRESLDRLPGAGMQQEGLTIETGPDGVRVERRQVLDGEEHVETYEAESLEELFEMHPELREDLNLSGPLGGGDGLRSLLDRLRVELDLPPSALDPGAVRTDVLGVMMREPGAWNGDLDGLEPGTGLLVETVLPGTIAEAVGLRPGDVVAELSGTPLRGADDVRHVLDARAADEPLEVVWFDRAGERRVRTWEP